MNERHEGNDSLSGSSEPGQQGFGTQQDHGAPTGWSAPEGYWGASSQPDTDASSRTLHERSDWTNGADAQDLSATASGAGSAGAYPQAGQYYPQQGQYAAQDQYPPTGQYPPQGSYPQGSPVQGAPAQQSDWDAWYSSFGGGGYPGDPNYAQMSTGGSPRPPRRGTGTRVAAIIACIALILAAAAAVIVPSAERSGLWPTSSSSSSVQAGSAQSGSSSDGSSGQSSDEPSSGEIGSGQTSVQTQTNATTAQSKGVVLIDTTTTTGSAAGTGMVLSSDGYVLTNYHVVESSTAIKVTVASTSKAYTATVVGHDATNDVALLKLNGASGLSTVSLDTDGVTLGEKVTAVGNSEGQGFLSAAAGSVTSTSATVTVSSELASSGSETLKDVYQTDTQAVPGDSGGPMYDAENEVVGITTAGEQSNSGSQDATNTVASWAIPISRALSIVDQIESGKQSGTVQIGPKAYLGVTVQAARGGGLVIAQVVSGGPADKAGLDVGDSITAINGTEITSQADLSDALDELEPGDRASLSVIDATTGETSTVTVTLGDSPIN